MQGTERGGRQRHERRPVPAACGVTSTRPAPTAAADRKVLLVRLDPDTMRRLKHLAVDRDCDLLFERYER